MSRAREVIGTILIGMAMGATLSRAGFTRWDEVNAMFTFSDLRLVLVFAVAVGLLVPSWIVISKISHPQWPTRGIHKGTAVGGLLFGAGWSLSGACPSIAFVQLGEGQLAAGVTIVGIVVGNYVYSVVHERYFRWSTGSCMDN